MTKKTTLVLLILACLIYACTTTPKQDIIQRQGTPVSVESISKTSLSNYIVLNAKSSFLLKTPIKSVANGYLQKVLIKSGDFVKKGQLVMQIITKEAKSIGNTINSIDTSFHFKGLISVYSPGTGYISQLNFQIGDYVQDGEQIALVSDAKSFAFILEMPYELTRLVHLNQNVKLKLSDGTSLDGRIEKPLPFVDELSQTQSYVIHVSSIKMIPENLLAKVSILKSSKEGALVLSKSAILTDETQSSFWVMKLLNDTTAIKVEVKIGLENDENVEIISPKFLSEDKILISGNFGLPDTALVSINKN